MAPTHPAPPPDGTDRPGPDPTRVSHWRPLRLLLDAMDADIARLYAERGVEGVRPRFVLPLVRLHHEGPMTIRDLASSLEVTHSAASQTVAAMRRDGLVVSHRGQDARSRVIALTGRARGLVPLLEAEWRATEDAIAELERELPYPLTRVVRDIEAALTERSFHDRVVARLPEDVRRGEGSGRGSDAPEDPSLGAGGGTA